MISYTTPQWQKMNQIWESQETPHISLTGELWGAYCEEFGKKLPRYNSTVLYIANKCVLWWRRRKDGVGRHTHLLNFSTYLICIRNTNICFSKNITLYISKGEGVAIRILVHVELLLQVCLWSWWRHQMETFSVLLAICAGNSPVPGEFPAQRSVTRSFDVFFDLRPNKRLSKQSWGWWFDTLSWP